MVANSGFAAASQGAAARAAERRRRRNAEAERDKNKSSSNNSFSGIQRLAAGRAAASGRGSSAPAPSRVKTITQEERREQIRKNLEPRGNLAQRLNRRLGLRSSNDNELAAFRDRTSRASRANNVSNSSRRSSRERAFAISQKSEIDKRFGGNVDLALAAMRRQAARQNSAKRTRT